MALVLPALWNESDLEKRSLLHTFVHLVSLANIAVAPTTSSSHITSNLTLTAACQMEITFMENFCRIGNLRTLLDMPGLPTSIQPHISQLSSWYDPILFQAQTDSYNPTPFLDDRFVKNHHIADVIYSVHDVNQNNSIVALKPGLQAAYGQLLKIFQNSRCLPDSKIETDVFCLIKSLMLVAPGHTHPHSQLSDKYDMRVSLCMSKTEETPILFHESEILCHCAWIRYSPGELTDQINIKTIALVSLDR
ncbi:hypothetical protein MJO29_004225 [Puccinia striiformis f. sp. tritici]|nr:hypothetical protein MJO29_004225 [Puccinia striiformis f. sp. tritici]